MRADPLIDPFRGGALRSLPVAAHRQRRFHCKGLVRMTVNFVAQKRVPAG